MQYHVEKVIICLKDHVNSAPYELRVAVAVAAGTGLGYHPLVGHGQQLSRDRFRVVHVASGRLMVNEEFPAPAAARAFIALIKDVADWRAPLSTIALAARDKKEHARLQALLSEAYIEVCGLPQQKEGYNA